MNDVERMMDVLQSLEPSTEGISVWVATDDTAVARMVAPMLAHRLYPWLERAHLGVLHVEQMGDGTEVVLALRHA